MADKKFDQFTDGGEMQVGDIPVGLRSSDLTKNFKFDFPGSGIKDSSGNWLFQYATAGAAAVNYLKLINSTTTLPVQLTADGSDINIDIAINPKGAGILILDGLNWPSADGVANQAIITDGAGQLGWGTVPIVSTPTTDMSIARFDGVNGALEDSGVTISDSDVMSGITQLNVDNLRLDGDAIQHIGDLDNQIIFGTDAQDFQTGGSSRLDLSDSGMRLGGANARVTTILTDTTMAAASNTNLYTGLAIKTYVDGRTATVGSAGTIMRSNGTNWVASTSTFANTYSASDLLYSNGANTVTGLATANSAVLRTNGTGVPAWSSSMTNGQLLIGSTGDAPVVATLTAGTGISIANAAGSITISGSGGGYSWTEVTGTSQSMAVNNGYIANNAGLVTLTLPSSAVVGDTVTVQGKGAGLFRIAQNEDQIIRFGSSSTTTGVGGYLEATNRYDSIELLCIMQDLEWAVLTGVQGIFTVV